MELYAFLRPLIFRLPPEQAHVLTLNLLRIANALPPVRRALQTAFRGPARPVEAFGLTFPNPVGLAAGYDKDGLTMAGLAALGFGHLEIGTVTLRPQAGNPRPRVFRYPVQQAVINRMGFPSQGAQRVAARLHRSRPRHLVLGVNIGKNKQTPLEEAAQDYLALMQTFAPLADYLTINISSPNTIGLRRLQGRSMLENLLREIVARRAQWEQPRPILVKLAPDLSDGELADALGVIQDAGLDGVIATNTTVSRHGLPAGPEYPSGGLSGAPLTAPSIAMIVKIRRLTGDKLPVIGVGGILSPQDARAKLDAGATLVQLYTGLIYHGPALVRQILESL